MMVAHKYIKLASDILIKHVQPWRIPALFIVIHKRVRQVVVYKMIMFMWDTRMPLHT